MSLRFSLYVNDDRETGLGCRTNNGDRVMSIAEATIEFAGGEADVIIEYNYTPALDGVHDRAPEDCYPGEPAELELTGLRIKMSERGDSVDVSGLLGYARIKPNTHEYNGRKALIESLAYAANEYRLSDLFD